jgi:hypothetical protein
MTTQIGDEIMIMSQKLHQLVREGEIRGVSDDPGGVVYVVRWSDTGHESLLRPGPDVVIKHRHGHGSGGAGLRLSWLRHPLEWRHSRDLEQTWSEGNKVGMSTSPGVCRTSSPGSA